LLNPIRVSRSILLASLLSLKVEEVS